MTHQEFLKNIHERNLLRSEIKQKRNILAKLRYHPETLDECRTLEHEIYMLEERLKWECPIIE